MSLVWDCGELKAPGNIFLPTAESDLLYVNEGWRSIAVLDAESGAVKSTHALDLPEGAGISRLDSPRGRLAGQAFAGFDILGKQVHLFDADWKRTFSYPPADRKHAGVSDVLLDDFNDDGKWQLAVGFWELLGVHGVDESGKRIWSNRECGAVQTLAATPLSPAGWRRIVVSGEGRLHSFNHHGNADPASQA